MSNLAEQKKYTYADYVTWEDDIRYELIDGIPYAMASPSQRHQEISGALHGLLWNFLRGKPCKVFHAPFDVRLNFDDYDDTVVIPDILVVCDKSKLDGKSVKGAPDLIIEILSPSTSRHDTFTKFRQYRKAGVKEYWIVDPMRKTIEAYTLENGKYAGRIYNDDDTIAVHVLAGCEINLSEVFYDTIEIIEIEHDSESSKRRLLEALKADGISDGQIEKYIKILNG